MHVLFSLSPLALTIVLSYFHLLRTKQKKPVDFLQTKNNVIYFLLTECSVKTVDGQSPGQCCHFPFLYKGVEQTSCVKAVIVDKKWCAVTYNYDKEKQWGWCPPGMCI